MHYSEEIMFFKTFFGVIECLIWLIINNNNNIEIIIILITTITQYSVRDLFPESFVNVVQKGIFVILRPILNMMIDKEEPLQILSD